MKPPFTNKIPQTEYQEQQMRNNLLANYLCRIKIEAEIKKEKLKKEEQDEKFQDLQRV